MTHVLLTAALLIQVQGGSVARGKQALAVHDFERARDLFRRAVQLSPDDGEAHFLLAQLCARDGDQRSAIEHFEAAIRLLPETLPVWRTFGAWLLQTGYFGEARRVCSHIVQQPAAESGDWIQLGLATYHDGDAEAALSAYRKGLGDDPTDARGLYLAAVAARSIGKESLARSWITRALGMRPDDAELNDQMAELLLAAGESEASIEYWERLAPADARRAYGRGTALLRMGRLKQAQGSFERVLELDPTHVQAHYQLGLLCSRTGRPQQAQAYFQRFRELDRLQRDRSRVKESKEIVFTGDPP